MDKSFRELERVLEHELNYYRCLVVLARTKHCLLRAGRQSEAAQLAEIESQLLAHLELLEVTRQALQRDNSNDSLRADALQTLEQTKAALIRRLRPIARANRAFDVQRIAARRAANASAVVEPMSSRPPTNIPKDAA